MDSSPTLRRYLKLTVDRRRAGFGESALTLSVVVISICFFFDPMTNTILLSFK